MGHSDQWWGFKGSGQVAGLKRSAVGMGSAGLRLAETDEASVAT